MHLDAQLARSLIQRLMQVRTMNDPIRRSKVTFKVWDQPRQTDRLAGLPATKDNLAGAYGNRLESRKQTPSTQQSGYIRAELNAGTDFAELRGCFKADDTMARQGAGDGGCKTTETGADDEDVERAWVIGERGREGMGRGRVVG